MMGAALPNAIFIIENEDLYSHIEFIFFDFVGYDMIRERFQVQLSNQIDRLSNERILFAFRRRRENHRKVSLFVMCEHGKRVIENNKNAESR